tara:strand:+ start:2863 stop:4122 length:1260 start_codon:yes stop_codon:yes gene_type:complete
MTREFQFGLHFNAGEVQFLLSDAQVTEWTVLQRVPLDSEDFDVEVTRFFNRVKRESDGHNDVAVFLPEPDVFVSEVSVIGRNKHRQKMHVMRALSRRMSVSSDAIDAVVGTVDQYNTAPVFYGKTETLSLARAFVERFGFEVAYFGALDTPRGFTSPPKLQVSKYQTAAMNRHLGAVTQGFYFAALTGVVSAIFLLLGTQAPVGRTQLATRPVQDHIYTAAFISSLKNTAALDVETFTDNVVSPSSGTLDVAYTLPGLTVPQVKAHAYARAFLKPAPRSVTRQIAMTMASPENLQAPEFKQLSDETVEMAMLLPAQNSVQSIQITANVTRTVPDAQTAQLMDQVAQFKGGFFVYIGQLQNKTMAMAAKSHVGDLGQVVFIGNKTIDPLNRVIKLPQFNLDRATLTWPTDQANVVFVAQK